MTDICTRPEYEFKTLEKVSLRIPVRKNLLQMFSLARLVLAKVPLQVGHLVCRVCLKLEIATLEQLHLEHGCRVQFQQMDTVPSPSSNFNRF